MGTPTLTECGVGQQCFNMQLQNKTYLAHFSNEMVSGYDAVVNGNAMTRLLNCALIRDLTMIMEVSVCGRNIVGLDSFLWSLILFSILLVFQVWILVAVYKRWNFQYSDTHVEAEQKKVLDAIAMADKQEALVLYTASKNAKAIKNLKITPDTADIVAGPRRRLEPI